MSFAWSDSLPEFAWRLECNGSQRMYPLRKLAGTQITDLQPVEKELAIYAEMRIKRVEMCFRIESRSPLSSIKSKLREFLSEPSVRRLHRHPGFPSN